MTEVDPTAQEYVRFDSEAEFQSALDRLLARPGRELRMFDPDMADLKLNSAARIDLLRQFLLASATRRVYMAVHDPDHLARYCPRMMNLIAQFGHVIAIHRTHDEIRELRDSFLVIDKQHYLRRPLARSFRGAIGINDEAEALTMHARFMEIWAASFPALSGTTLGL